MGRDKQLRAVTLDQVVEKRRLGQALNAKEFAVLAGVSYSTAREWFRAPGFPVFRGYVFWQDFTDWRRGLAEVNGFNVALRKGTDAGSGYSVPIGGVQLPPKAARILAEQ